MHSAYMWAMTRHSRKASQQRKASPKKTRSFKSSTEKRVRQVRQDMRKDSSLSLARASRRRRIDPRTVLKHDPTGFRKDTSGRIRACAVPSRQKILYIPWFEPGEVKPIPTKSKAERLLVGRWMAALNSAGRNDWSKMNNFPRGKRVGGVLLPTNPAEIQQILKSLADKESPFEGLYRTIVRRR
jgi:hypothetical protein